MDGNVGLACEECLVKFSGEEVGGESAVHEGLLFMFVAVRGDFDEFVVGYPSLANQFLYL